MPLTISQCIIVVEAQMKYQNVRIYDTIPYIISNMANFPVTPSLERLFKSQVMNILFTYLSVITLNLGLEICLKYQHVRIYNSFQFILSNIRYGQFLCDTDTRVGYINQSNNVK